jgi:hypothetical protein
MDDERPLTVRTRLRTTADPIKGLQQLHELVSKGEVNHAVIIAEMRDGIVHVLGQRASPEEMGRLLIIAGDALTRAGGFDPDAERNTPAPPEGEDTIAAAWASLEACIFDAHTPPIQRREMRQAFYAGASSLFGLLMGALDPEDETTPADLERMDGWKTELEQFAAQTWQVVGRA